MPRLRHFLRPQSSSLPDHQHPAARDRARPLDSERFKRKFVTTLADLRGELGFRIVGYVLIRHLTDSHLLLWPSDAANPTHIMQRLEKRTAKLTLKNLRENLEYPWCQEMLARVTLPPSVHDHARFRVWQRRFNDMSIWIPKKREEKLNATIPSSAAR